MKEYILKFIDELKYERHYSELTIDGYLHDLNVFLEYLNDSNIKKYSDVEYQDIRLFISSLYESYNSKTISRYISSIKSFFKYLKKENIINNNPCILISNPKLEKKLPKYLNFNDTKKFLNAYSTDDYIGLRNSLILELIYSTGIRVSEVCNIKLNDISKENKTIVINGKGKKERIVYFGNICLDLMNNY